MSSGAWALPGQNHVFTAKASSMYVRRSAIVTGFRSLPFSAAGWSARRGAYGRYPPSSPTCPSEPRAMKRRGPPAFAPRRVSTWRWMSPAGSPFAPSAALHRGGSPCVGGGDEALAARCRRGLVSMLPLPSNTSSRAWIVTVVPGKRSGERTTTWSAYSVSASRSSTPSPWYAINPPLSSRRSQIRRTPAISTRRGVCPAIVLKVSLAADTCAAM